MKPAIRPFRSFSHLYALRRPARHFPRGISVLKFEIHFSQKLSSLVSSKYAGKFPRDSSPKFWKGHPNTNPDRNKTWHDRHKQKY